jgi:protease II
MTLDPLDGEVGP